MQIMSNENGCELVGTVQAFQQFEDHFAGPEIQIPRRFVREQDRWFSHQRTGQNNPLLLSPRQFTGAM
jgi:hypothetical protein